MESGGADEYAEFVDYSLFFILPPEIIINIFRKLTIYELSYTIPTVCKHWYLISTDNVLWRELYSEQWQTIPQSLRQQLTLSPKKGGKRFARFNLSSSTRSFTSLPPAQSGPIDKQALNEALAAALSKEESDSGEDSGDESFDDESEASNYGSEEEIKDEIPSPRMFKRKGKLDGYDTDDEAVDMFSSEESDSDSQSFSSSSVTEVTPLPSDEELEDNTTDADINWRTLFLERVAGEKNWREGNYTVSTLKGHSLAIMSVKFVDETVYSCSLDGTIKTWDMNARKCTATFTGHTDWVNSFDLCSTMSGNISRLVSCSFDTSIKLWDTKKSECLSTLWGHQNIVWSVKMADNKLVSCSSDSTIRVWDIEAGTCINTLTGHDGAIYCMYYDKERNIAVSGCQDKTVRFWDLNSLGDSNGGCVGTLRGHADRLCCLQWDGDQSLLVTGSHDSCIKLWDARMLDGNDGSISISVKSTGEEGDNSAACIRTLTGHKGRVCCLQFDHEKIVSGSDDNKIKVWSLYGDEGENGCFNTLADHDYWVNTLYFKDNMLVSGAADDTIKIWDFSGKRKTKGGSSKAGSAAMKDSWMDRKDTHSKSKEGSKWKTNISSIASNATAIDWGKPSFSLAQTLSVADRCVIC